jgi:hypothetical protein
MIHKKYNFKVVTKIGQNTKLIWLKRLSSVIFFLKELSIILFITKIFINNQSKLEITLCE